MQIVVRPGGEVRCVYDEAIDLATLGPPKIARGSHVEPDDEGRWWADLGPANGPKLGPFGLRTVALDAERDWLNSNWLDHASPATDHVHPPCGTQ